MKLFYFKPLQVCLLLAVSFANVALGAGAVISQSAGEVADRVVTTREVHIATLIDSVIFPQKDKVYSSEFKLDSAETSREVTALLLEIVVFMEAENFSVVRATDEQINEALRKAEKALEGKPVWASLEVSNAELKKIVTQKLVAKGFIRFKTSSMVGVISD
ncbi:MAG: hypothetical protein EOP06_20565, partial [Proteobacteria bacterium]